MPKFFNWSNQPLRLFHGTTKSSAQLILQNVDLSRCRSKTDFGRGFYTTTWFDQARNWAVFLAAMSPGQTAAVVAFDVDRVALALLESMSFVRGACDADDYWSLVNHCRLNGCHIPASSWYDVVFGPVSVFPWSRKRIHLDFDQISFHSTRATSVLDSSPKVIIDVN